METGMVLRKRGPGGILNLRPLMRKSPDEEMWSQFKVGGIEAFLMVREAKMRN